MIKTNRDYLVKQSVQGQVSPPKIVTPYRMDSSGNAHILPATGGISYNVFVGDSAMCWVGDHVEPGVSIKNRDSAQNTALNTLCCIGNQAIVVSGEAKGATGFVTGTHGGIDHVLVYFPAEVLEKLTNEDQILVKSFGQGFAMHDMADVFLMNLDPALFDKMNCNLVDGILEVPVTHILPAYLMGSGIGSGTAANGDYDIMTADASENERLGLDKLRFGDIVMLKDCDTTYGRGYLSGAVTIGVVIHSDCIKMGHGPGVTTLMTCKTAKIRGVIHEDANIAIYMGVVAQ